MNEISTKPYLIRAIFEWCNDAGFTPYLNVKVDEHVRVPIEYVKNGEIVLSVAAMATRDLTIGNDWIQFSARFNGVSREISIPTYAVQAIFARENGRGYFFEPEGAPGADAAPAPGALSSPTATPFLQAVPSSLHGGTDSATDTASVSTAPVMVPDAELADQAHKLAESDVPDSPNSPKGSPRGNLRVIK